MSAQRLKYKGRHVSRTSPSIFPLRNSHHTPNFKPLEPYNNLPVFNSVHFGFHPRWQPVLQFLTTSAPASLTSAIATRIAPLCAGTTMPPPHKTAQLRPKPPIRSAQPMVP